MKRVILLFRGSRLYSMDPLGAVDSIVDYTQLERWNTTEVPQYDIRVDDPASKKTSPFKYDEELNRKIILW